MDKKNRLKKNLIHPEFVNLDKDIGYLELVNDLKRKMLDGQDIASPSSSTDSSQTFSSTSSSTTISLSTPPPIFPGSKPQKPRSRSPDLCDTLQKHHFIQNVIPEEQKCFSSRSSLSSSSISSLISNSQHIKSSSPKHLDELSKNIQEIGDFITVTEEILKRDRERDEEFYARERNRRNVNDSFVMQSETRKSALNRKFSLIERPSQVTGQPPLNGHASLRQTKSSDHQNAPLSKSKLYFRNGKVGCLDPELGSRNCVQKTHELVKKIIDQEHVMPLVAQEHVERVLTNKFRRDSIIVTEDFEMTNVTISEDLGQIKEFDGAPSTPIEDQKVCLVESESVLNDKECSRIDDIMPGENLEMTIIPADEEFFVRERIQHLIHRFTDRARKMRNRIEMPPTPSSDGASSPTPPKNNNMRKSQSGLALLQNKLHLSHAPSHANLHSTQKDSRRSLFQTDGKEGSNCTHWMCPTFCGGGRPEDVLDPQGRFYISWLFVVTLSFLYNAYVIPFRVSFPFQTPSNTPTWMAIDYTCDLIYLLDIIFVKHRLMYLYDGFWVKDKAMTRQNYIRKLQFKMDVISLVPLDILYIFFGTGAVYLRAVRLLKIQSFWEFFKLLDRVLSSPHIVRVAKTLTYMLFMIHVTACLYYYVSAVKGLGTNRWVFSGKGHPYVRCFAFATKTATSIGKNPKPQDEDELVFMTFAWLMGVFVFALLIGQIRDIIATATRSQSEYKQLVDETLEYMRRLSLPTDLQRRVKMWYTFTWEQQRTLDESHILDSLPANLKTDIAISVHIQTLSKVQLFADCEEALLRELVLKLRSVTFLPGDYVCRKGEVGKEMYIVKLGQVQVMGGPHSDEVLATLSEGSVFGEISLLNINGPEGNRRTADVKSKGFSNLFVLSKSDLNEAIVYYPNAQMVLKRRARSLMRRNAAREAKRSAASGDESDVVIENPKTPQSPPRLLQTVMKALPEESNAAVLLTQGSKRRKRKPSPKEAWIECKEQTLKGCVKTLSCDLLLSIQNELDSKANLTDSEKEMIINEKQEQMQPKMESDSKEQDIKCDVVVHREPEVCEIPHEQNQ